jgi:hypothetical protein
MRKAFRVPLRINKQKSGKIGAAKSAIFQSIRKKGVHLPSLKFLDKKDENQTGGKHG